MHGIYLASEGFTLIASGLSADRAALDWQLSTVSAMAASARADARQRMVLPERYRLQETTDANYSLRTGRNVHDSNATLTVTLTDHFAGNSKCTRAFAVRLGKSWVHMCPGVQPNYMARFLNRHGVRSLDLADKHKSSAPASTTWSFKRCRSPRVPSRLQPDGRDNILFSSIKEAHVSHIVLLGDSIFDNAPYVPAGMHVEAQLQSLLAPQDRVSLLARDGDVLADITAQVARLQALPEAVDWLVVSCGGNDVLDLIGAMQTKVGSVIEATTLLAEWQAQFRSDYRRMLNVLLPRRKPVALATIYDGVPGLAPGLKTALAPFNDVILREAVAHRLPVLDLRLICDDADDYAAVSPIEPSARGGGKIAAAIAQLVQEQDFGARRTVVYGDATS